MAELHTRQGGGGLGTFRVGTPRGRGDGFRIAITRRPQRGVRRERLRIEGRFDAWYPHLAPSAELVSAAMAGRIAWDRFFDRYEREVTATAEMRQALELLAALSLRMPVSVGCFCEDIGRCHRSRLFGLLAAKRRELAAG